MLDDRADARSAGKDSATGLCANCIHLREQPTRRGASFWRCARAEEDDRFVRYPPLPVRSCAGFEATS